MIGFGADTGEGRKSRFLFCLQRNSTTRQRCRMQFDFEVSDELPANHSVTTARSYQTQWRDKHDLLEFISEEQTDNKVDDSLIFEFRRYVNATRGSTVA